MATTPAALGRRYSPLLILAAVQLLLVVLSPSVPKGQGSNVSSLASGPIASGAAGSGGAAIDPATGQPIDPATGLPVGAAGGGAGGAAGGGGGAGGVGGAAGGGAGGGRGGVGGAGGAGGPADRSHCGPDGKQLSPTFYMPPCAAVFHGDNGGSTMQGVSADKVNYVYYVAQGNAQVNAILNAEGLAATPEQTCERIQAFDKWANKRFELYGRKFNSLDGPGNNKGSTVNGNNQPNCRFPYFQGQCSLTPPDPACERAEADVIASMKPAWVIAPVADPAFFNQLGKDHVVVSGNYLVPAPNAYHQNLAPYFYDIATNGDRAASQMAEYYCKKLANHPVVHAGRGNGDVIPLTGNAPMRKAAIIYPSTNGDPTFTDSANLFLKLIGQCGAGDAKAYPYQSDINTAQTQSNTTVAALKQNHVTTVVFYGDPIAPVFLSNTLDSQGYHPEIMISGTGVVDYDVLGQLYNKNVWKNAFGPSDLGNSVPFAETDATKAWQDAGNSGQPDGTSNVSLNYYAQMGAAFQTAGPRPSPQSIHDGLFGAPALGGDAVHPLVAYGRPDDYTGLKDAREVYWCNAARSPINGQLGAYIPVDGGKRYQLGQWPSGEPKVFPDATC